MPQQVEMGIKVIDQFLDIAVHEKSGAERLLGFIQAPVAVWDIYVVHCWVGRGLLRIKHLHLLIYLLHCLALIIIILIFLTYLHNARYISFREFNYTSSNENK